MELFVNANMVASDLIERFNNIYPFLRLEIYYRGEEMCATTNHFLLSEIVHRKNLENFVIAPEMKVSEVENLFCENMDLQVSIFRKSGKTWLESSFTNYWSLERQNSLGREMNDFMKIETKRMTV